MKRRLASAAQAVRAAVLAALPSLLRQWLPGGEQRGDVYFALNPRRRDRNLGSFQINTSTGKWRDHAIGEGGGDAISLYAYLFMDGDYRAAFKALANDPQIRAAAGVKAPPAKVAVPAKAKAARVALARRIYTDALPPFGKPAAFYLIRLRGPRPTAAWDGLRAKVLPYRGHGAHPALIAPLQALDGSVVGLQLTYLTQNGAKADLSNPRLSMGLVRGHAIHLEEPTDELIICEGLEDGLTLYQRFRVPVWVACGAALMAKMAIPDSVRRLAIAADNDIPGELAAQHAADVFGVGGRDVRIIRPANAFKDFNDEIRGIKS